MRFFSCVLLLSSVLVTSCAYQTVSPNSSEVSDSKRLSFAQTYLLLGQPESAKKQLNLVNNASQGKHYWRLLSLYWLTLDHYDEAEFVHRKALLKYPKDDFLLNNYGVLLGRKNRWNDACKIFEKANESIIKKRQSVQINLSRCALRKNEVNLAQNYLKQAKEIADLPLIGLMTELNLVLIQGSPNKARIILNNIQAGKEIARGTVHFDEYNCLSLQLNTPKADSTKHPPKSDFSCLNGSRY